MKILKLIFFSLLLISFFSCKETDDTPPRITMNFADPINSNDSTGHVLNQPYVDPGATAWDDFDGDITASIYVNNPVNENRVGWYEITYDVVDQAGNEAPTTRRWLYVYNKAQSDSGSYNVFEQKLYPIADTFQYQVNVYADSLVNQRIVIMSLAGDLGQPIYGDVVDSLIVIPFQVAQYDSVNTYSIQGSGLINDSLIVLEYKKIDSLSSLWRSELKR
ncbi:MAG: DUF5011 domain-containing protein [Chlorobi bacterium]|nr:DUF5011 domain-containing protein [Chlorobiota bacterium]